MKASSLALLIAVIVAACATATMIVATWPPPPILWLLPGIGIPALLIINAGAVFNYVGNHPPAKMTIELAAAATVVAGVVGLFFEFHERERARILNAWQVIAAGPSAQGNIGQRAALKLLRDRRQDLRKINLSHAQLDEFDLSGQDLEDARFQEANLLRANLRGADLSGATLYSAVLQGADLRNASLGRARLGGAILTAADLRGATLRYAELTQVQLSGTKLRGAELTRAVLSRVDKISDLSAACYLRNAYFDGKPDLPSTFPKEKWPQSESDPDRCPRPLADIEAGD